MKNMTLENIANACGGTYYGREADRQREIEEIVTDSRQAKEGSLFVAIKGERVDAHRFIPAVFEQGASCVLSEQVLEDAAGAYILVPSTLQAIKDIAEFYRQQLDLKVVGITGSVGKTSTKEMIASVLSEKFQVLKTLGNFNNELGLPLTVFRLREGDEVAVLEMGINHFGEMHRLSKVARPDICVITNIGQCHLEFLGDRDGVLKAKSEIFDFIAPNGTVVLNGDDDKLAAVQEVRGNAPIFFGNESNREIYATDIRSAGIRGVWCKIHVRDEVFEVCIPIPGYHMVMNALAATAVGRSLGMTNEEIKRGIEKLEALSGRFHIIEKNGITVIDDCYNANPVSMKASLKVLNDAETQKAAILGDMGELGEEEQALHAQIGEYLGELDIQKVICIGELAKEIAEAGAKAKPQMQIWTAENVEEAKEHLSEWIQKGDTVLVKASHFMHFENIVEALTKE